MSNITSIEINNKKMSAGLIPSKTSIQLDSPTITDGSASKEFKYTAIEDGYYVIEFGANNYDGSNLGAIISNITRKISFSCAILNQCQEDTKMLPCLKNDSILVWFQNHVKVNKFRFIYAIGSEPQE